MKELNLNTRVLMFAVCTSIEFDLRKFINDEPTNVAINKELIHKAKNRNKFLNGNMDSSNYEILVELDMGDLVAVIQSNPVDFRLGVEKSKKLKSYFDKIIPIRNRVMHTRPLEVGDRSVLTEVAERISLELPFIHWNEVIKTREIILNRPHEIFIKSHVYERDTHVYHNLPIPEFDDTGFIGRKEETKEILTLLLNKKDQVISIVGNGGLGKTATAVKVLYELIDRVDNPFEAILWVSLKTRTLSRGEFSNIKNAIVDLKGFYSNLEDLVIKDSANPIQNILTFMSEFKTLLVLDNLETLNTTEIIDFLKSIPEESKVLITSRHGIRELENRYPLKGLNINDSVTYFRLLSRYYNLDLYTRPDEEIKELIQDYLYQSPLSIKWFLSSLNKGIDEKAILANKDQLIEFCMSNVVEKLSIEEKEILKLFLVEGRNLSSGEIDFFINISEDILMLSLNNLISTSLLSLSKAEYSMNPMAKDFLSKNNPPTNEFIQNIATKRSNLNSLLQEIKVKNEIDPFNPKSLYRNLESTNSKIASFHLMNALKNSAHKNWDESFKCLDKALSIAPDYFEVYKIKAFISAENSDWYNAIENYRIAIEMCKSDIEKASVLYLYSCFYTIKMQDNDQAKQIIFEASSLDPGNIIIECQKGRTLTYLGEYPEAEEIFSSINFEEIQNDKLKNQYITQFAELYKRMGEVLEVRDAQSKIEYYKKGLEKIYLLDNIDYKTVRVLIKILNELSFLYYSEEAIKLIEEAVNGNFDALLDANQTLGTFTSIYNNLLKKPEIKGSELLNKVRLISIKYKQYATGINDPNMGMIIKKLDTYGFIDNKFGSHYYNVAALQYSEPAVGDTVSFEIVDNEKGKVSIKINLQNRFDI